MREMCSKNYERAIDLLSGWELETMRQKLQQYAEKVKMLNMYTELLVTRQNIVDAIKFHAADDEQFLGLIDDLEIIGQTFYNTLYNFTPL